MNNMKKFSILSLLLLLCTLNLHAEKSSADALKLHVRKAGTLHHLIEKKHKSHITGLSLSGVLNNDDLRTLRYLCGAADKDSKTHGKIKRLDLSNVSFAAGGKPYYISSSGQEHGITSATTLPYAMLYNSDIEHVTLPLSIDSIAPYALSRTGIKSINIPDGCNIAEDAFYRDSMLQVVELGDFCTRDIRKEFRGCDNIRELTFHSVECIVSNTFNGNDFPKLESIDFKGFVGHCDGYTFQDLDNLQYIRFSGDVYSMGGPLFAIDCPNLDSLIIDGMVLSTGFASTNNCPQFKGIAVNGTILKSGDTEALPETKPDDYDKIIEFERRMSDMAEWTSRWLLYNGKSPIQTALKRIAALNYRRLKNISAGSNIQGLKGALDEIERQIDPDLVRTYQEILQHSESYERTGQQYPVFSYAQPSDSLLTRTREYFNLDSIAGNGDDVSRIKRVMYWLHDNVRHDGSSPWPKCRFNAVDIYKMCKQENRGVNCRFLAIMLNEMLLSIGIPCRYLTCLPKVYVDDCHVINIAWSSSLNKWIWIDPSFASYVTDENGLMLHPGEVRMRLINGQPLYLNEDANWNNEVKQTAAHYLYEYMAKNLYLISSCTTSQSEPEGESNHPQTPQITLVPKGFKVNNNQTSDDKYFWQPPTISQ